MIYRQLVIVCLFFAATWRPSAAELRYTRRLDGMQDRPVSGAKFRLLAFSAHMSMETIGDPDETFALSSVSPAEYGLRAAASGFCGTSKPFPFVSRVVTPDLGFTSLAAQPDTVTLAAEVKNAHGADPNSYIGSVIEYVQVRRGALESREGHPPLNLGTTCGGVCFTAIRIASEKEG